MKKVLLFIGLFLHLKFLLTVGAGDSDALMNVNM